MAVGEKKDKRPRQGEGQKPKVRRSRCVDRSAMKGPGPKKNRYKGSAKKEHS